jgi:DNA-binding transcriptional LysR family regulator
MNVGQLATLAAIIERGSFAAAAQAVGCTPSAVSLQVKQLEAYFGRQLFDRSTRSVRPTELAREVAAIGRELMQRLDALRRHAKTAVAGRVRLGAITSVQTDVLPPALHLLRSRHPQLQVQVSLDDSAALLAAVKGGRLDVAVVVRPPSGATRGVQWHDLVRQPFVMLVPADAPNATPQALLQQRPWIRYDRQLTGGRIAARYVQRICPQANVAIDLRSIDAIVAMVAAGLGVSVIPQPRRALLDAQAVRELRLGAQAPRRQISLVQRSADADDRNLQAVHAAFASVYGARSAQH